MQYNKNNFTGYNPKSESRARALRKNMTAEERHLWYDFLRTYPVKIYRQRAIDVYIVDFYCSAAKLVIEIDGGQHYMDESVEYDAKRTRVLEDYGLEVVRVTNTDVKCHFREVCEMIDNKIRLKSGGAKKWED